MAGICGVFGDQIDVCVSICSTGLWRSQTPQTDWAFRSGGSGHLWCMRLAEVRAKQRERKREKLGWAKGSYSCPLYPTVFLNLSWITAGAVGTWLDLSQIEKSITHTYISIYRQNKLHSSRFLLCLQCILIRHGERWMKKEKQSTLHCHPWRE